MASILSAGTTTATGLNFSADTTGILQLASNNGTVGLTMDTSQNVGIGTSSPACQFDVAGLMRSTSVVGYPSSGAGLEMYYTAGQGFLLAYDRSGSTYKPINLNGSQLIFTAGGVEAARIDSSGNVTLQKNISVGAAAPTTSGTGITFPATQSASSDANTLDDYEEGTWTPSIGGTATYTVQIGQYTKIGRLVTIVARLFINAVGTGDTGRVTGVPFANAQTLSSISVSYYAGSLTSYASIYGYLNGSTIDIVATAAGGSASSTDAAAFFKNSTELYFTCTYFAST